MDYGDKSSTSLKGMTIVKKFDWAIAEMRGFFYTAKDYAFLEHPFAIE